MTTKITQQQKIILIVLCLIFCVYTIFWLLPINNSSTVKVSTLEKDVEKTIEVPVVEKVGAVETIQSNTGSANTISIKKVLQMANEIPEIVDWKALFSNNGVSPGTGGTPHVVIFREDKDFYYIQAFEEIKNSEVPHNVAFGFYMINKHDMSVYKELIF